VKHKPTGGWKGLTLDSLAELVVAVWRRLG